jgi:AraC family transcriptional regulator of adaptative response / DNA-3-methyladenine glycosylase II
MGRSAIVQRALRLISARGISDLDEDQFAEQLGVSARHLRRLFMLELGQTPKRISDLNRLGFARRLVVETRIPITDIVSAAGFGSIRRLNEAFKMRFHRSPSELRKSQGWAGDGEVVTLRLAYRPPYDWQSILDFFRAHELFGIESVIESGEGDFYQRVFRSGSRVGAFRVSRDVARHELKLSVSLSDPGALYQIAQRVRQMFDLDSDPLLIGDAFSSCQTMSAFSEKYPGLRLPCGWDPFETSIGIILGQLVSLDRARALVRQLIEGYGRTVRNPLTGGESYLFPEPEVLATASLEKVRTTGRRKETIREFAHLVAEKKLRLDGMQDLGVFRGELLAVKGIGPWTVEMICMRALGDTDAFPKKDLILQRALERHKGLDAARFKPWQSYAALCLWKEYAGKKP